MYVAPERMNETTPPVTPSISAMTQFGCPSQMSFLIRFAVSVEIVRIVGCGCAAFRAICAPVMRPVR